MGGRGLFHCPVKFLGCVKPRLEAVSFHYKQGLLVIQPQIVKIVNHLMIGLADAQPQIAFASHCYCSAFVDDCAELFAI